MSNLMSIEEAAEYLGLTQVPHFSLHFAQIYPFEHLYSITEINIIPVILKLRSSCVHRVSSPFV